VSTYQPMPGVYPGRPPCANCHAARRLHRDHTAPCEARAERGIGGCWCARLGAPFCPEAYRPTTVEVARRELEAAEATGDQARIFVARGNLQRLEGRPPGGTKVPAK
jgi:hypothetical protein